MINTITLIIQRFDGMHLGTKTFNLDIYGQCIMNELIRETAIDHDFAYCQNAQNYYAKLLNGEVLRYLHNTKLKNFTFRDFPNDCDIFTIQIKKMSSKDLCRCGSPMNVLVEYCSCFSLDSSSSNESFSTSSFDDNW